MLNIMLVGCKTDQSATLKSALEQSGHEEINIINCQDNLLASIREKSPDLIMIDIAEPEKVMFDELKSVHSEIPKPIIFFAEKSDSETIQAAIDAGVTAYIVDGISEKRIQPIVDVALARFNESQKMKAELDDYKQKLEDRKDVDRAKGFLMTHHNINEDEAYKLLRKMAMNKNMRLGELARSFIATLSLLEK